MSSVLYTQPKRRSMRSLFLAYKALLSVEWAVMMAYRSETYIWLLGAVIQPIVSLAVWTSISANGPVGGFKQADYVIYFLGVLLVERLTRSWDVWELDRDIRIGTFSVKLLLPIHPIHWSLAQNLVYKLFFSSILIPLWLLAAIFITDVRLPIPLYVYGLALLAIIGSSALRFITGYAFGLLAIWSNRAVAIFALYEAIHLFLAGRIAPLAMFPEWVAWIGKILPFYATIGFPVELLAGHLNGHPQQIAVGFISQAVWLVILYILLRVEWKRGMIRYGAVGG